MSTPELPKNWVMLKSAKYPDQPYYFNTSTNESTWICPAASQESSKMQLRHTRKRKDLDQDGSESSSDTVRPEPASPPPTDRPKLKGKRQLAPKTDDDEHPKETPQMKALREKMLLRQSQGNAVRKSKIIRSPEVKSSPSRKKSTEEPAEPPSLPKLNPQMRDLQERINARRSINVSGVKKAKSVSSDTSRRKSTRRLSLVTTATQDSAISIDLSNPNPPNKKQRLSLNDRLHRMRTIEAPPGVSAQRVLVDQNTTEVHPTSPPASPTNCIRDEYLDLQKTYELTKKNEASTCKVDTRPRKKPHRSTIVDPKIYTSERSPPTIYKSAEERLRNLRKRLSIEAEEIMEKRKAQFDETDPEFSMEPDAVLEKAIQTTSPCYEDMEWEPIEEEKIVSEIQSVRVQLSLPNPASPSQTNQDPVNLLSLKNAGSAAKSRVLYIVIDTNVFLTSLQAVETARDAVFKNFNRPYIVVPWTVIRELDYIKDDKSSARPESLKSKARRAIRFIHDHFAAKHPRFLGQSPQDAICNRETLAAECPDDEILQTCLQIRSSRNLAVLLSYDTNLCNKAMIHDVVTLGRMDPLEKLDFLIEIDSRDESTLSMTLKTTGDDPKEAETLLSKELASAEELFEETTNVLTSFMTVIVSGEMKNLFGDDWERYTIIRPPWNTTQVLKCAIKHWIAAVSESFVRSAEPIIKDLHEIVNKLQFGRKLHDVDRLIERCFDLIQCLKVDRHRAMMLKFSKIIDNLRHRHQEMIQQLHEYEINERSERNEREQEKMAATAFQFFEEIYAYARNFGGTVAELMEMPCTFSYKKYSGKEEDFKRLRPEVAANVNRLLQVLGTALEDITEIHPNHRSVQALYTALVTSPLALDLDTVRSDLTTSDVYWCLQRKTREMKVGLGQLQMMSSHFCRMASFKAT